MKINKYAFEDWEYGDPNLDNIVVKQVRKYAYENMVALLKDMEVVIHPKTSKNKHYFVVDVFSKVTCDSYLSEVIPISNIAFDTDNEDWLRALGKMCSVTVEKFHDDIKKEKLNAAIRKAKSIGVNNDLALVDLRAYMLAHEQDIAHSINDFGDLYAAFERAIGRSPKR